MNRLINKKWLVGTLVALLLVAAMARLASLQGLLFPVRVSGGSMADGLVGEHHAVVCEDCSFSFRCAAEPPPRTGSAVCPNCGYAANPLDPSTIQKGQRVLVDRLALRLRPARRWERVAFRDPQGTRSVKRVIGMPGEQVRIFEGEISIDGQILRKSLAQLRGMAILVHDDRYRPLLDQTLPSRWNSDRQPSRWQAGQRGYTFSAERPGGSTADEAGEEAVEWLRYCHWRCYAGPAGRAEEAPIRDHYGYNQGVSREPRPARDLLLDCQVQLGAEGRLYVRIRDGHGDFQVRLDDEGDLQVHRGSTRVAAIHASGFRRDRPQRLELGLFDQQCVLALEERVLWQTQYAFSGRDHQEPFSPLAIGADRGLVDVQNLKVFRDIVYLDPLGLGDEWQLDRPLAADEYLLLGDNPPVSLDSRHWKRPGLPRRRLLGPIWPRARGR